jgi:hypothetical protein
VKRALSGYPDNAVIKGIFGLGIGALALLAAFFIPIPLLTWGGLAALVLGGLSLSSGIAQNKRQAKRNRPGRDWP